MFVSKFIRLLLLVGALAPLAAGAEDQVIAKVNGVAIPQSRLELILKSQISQSQGQQQDTPEYREELRDILITREVLYQEALRRKLDKDPNYLAQLDVMKQQILLSVLFDDFVKKNSPTEQATRKEYDRVKAESANSGAKQYKVRHILVKEQGDATQIIASLKKGADFAAIAKEKSLDTGSKEEGGELDWSEPERYVQPFGEAIMRMKKGEISAEPVQTSFGYHVIQVLDERKVPFPEYDQVKQQIERNLLGKSRDDLINSLRTKAKIEKVGALAGAEGKNK